MKFLVLKEKSAGEDRVALTPDLIAKYKKLNSAIEIFVEKSAGIASGISDEEFEAKGAKIVAKIDEVLPQADAIFAVQENGVNLTKIKKGSFFIGSLNPYFQGEKISQFAKAGISAFALELLPRITRAQSMDILSSQSNLAGYRSVIDGFAQMNKAAPMMMTAAGTITAAKVLVLGAGVAGLQAIATAKRLGAVVYAFDVRPETKEQVQSLGGKFVEVKADEKDQMQKGAVYAKEMSEDYKKRQEKAIFEQIIKMDLVITTALIPGKKAPILISEEMVNGMQAGSVIVDLAAVNGGNCALTKSGEEEISLTKNGVKIVAYNNFPARCAKDASKLFAKNIYNFVELLLSNESKTLQVDLNDEIVKATLVTHEGVELFKTN